MPLYVSPLILPRSSSALRLTTPSCSHSLSLVCRFVTLLAELPITWTFCLQFTTRDHPCPTPFDFGGVRGYVAGCVRLPGFPASPLTPTAVTRYDVCHRAISTTTFPCR